MRRRLVLSTLAVALISVILLGVPLGVVASWLIHDEAQVRLDREAASVVSAVDALRGTDRPLDSSALLAMAPADEHVSVAFGEGSPVSVGPIPDDTILTASARGGYNELVTVSASDKDVRNQVTTMWLVVSCLGGVALGVAVGLAALQAKRLGSPLEELVAAAERLGSGDPSPNGRRYRVPEIDKVARMLDASSQRIAQLLRGERELAANASHQLRTPLTAMSIRLEEIIATAGRGEVRAEATAALAAVERLTEVVDSLLTDHAHLSRSHHHVEIVDVDGVIEQQCEEWTPAFRRVGRVLAADGDRGLKASGNHVVIGQTLASLIENALVHGDGTVRVSTRQAADHVVVDVSDEGEGVADELRSRIFERSFSGSSSTGLGLSLARDLVEADGGRLELSQVRPPVFSIFLTPAP